MEPVPYLVLNKLSAPVPLEFEPVGRWFECYGGRVAVISEGLSVGSDNGERESDGSDTEEINPLLLDPTQWKDQDHYAILGLGRLRYKATAQDIRKAYRQKVLQHHPDKQQQQLEAAGQDSYFKCIKIANDILSMPKRRRAYDSVDPTFSDTVPPVSSHSKENFHEVFGPIFRENARWSVKQPVPQPGDSNSSLEEVDAFYSFWYDFESWREFSYLDEENLEKAECREERRWMEKQNKFARQKRKKEEMARIRTLVDNAYACDGRVKRFKEAEKAAKVARKRAREEAAKQESMQLEQEQQRKLEEERQLKIRQEEEARTQAAQVKKEKEAVKKVVRREKRKFRDACKAHNYFASSDSEVVSRMQDLERLCETLSLERIQELSEKFSQMSMEEAQSIFDAEVVELQRHQEEQMAVAQAKAKQSASSQKSSRVDNEWSREEVQLLIKAVTLYPAGTVKRWETIATFVNAHSPEGSKEKTTKLVISKMKELQRLDSSEKDTENKTAFDKFKKQHSAKGHVEAAPTERYDAPKPWTADEQKLLEQALKTYPSTTPERWEKIASTLPSRTKAECIARFKELVARVKAKKQQQTS